MDRIRIVGGPRDGELVDHLGPVWREPVLQKTYRADPTSLDAGFEFREYRLHRWQTEDGRIEPRYVLRSHERGLGVFDG